MERAWSRVPHAASRSRSGDPLLPPRSGWAPDRGRSDEPGLPGGAQLANRGIAGWQASRQPGAWQDGSMRRLMFIGSAVVFLDVVFYAAITPLLPGYVDDLGLSKTSAGVLSGAYAAGTLIASLPAGFMAARLGPRRTLIAGLVLLGVASLAFGFGRHIVVLDLARFVQGAAGALAWSGAITWLMVTTAESRRGAVIGDVLAIAIAGTLLGPAVGVLAHAIGTKPVFSSVVVVAAVLSVLALRLPIPGHGDRVGVREAADAIRRRPVLQATGLVMAPSVFFGVIAVLVPLRINSLGGGAGVVAAGFMAGA